MLAHYSKLVYICPEQSPLEHRFLLPLFRLQRCQVGLCYFTSPVFAVDPLLKTLKCKHAGLSIHGNFMGGAAHADNLRTITTSKCSVVEQANIINKFISGNHLKLNSSKQRLLRSPIAIHRTIISLCFLPISILLPRGSVLSHGGSTTARLYDLFKKILLKQEELFSLLGRSIHSKSI